MKTIANSLQSVLGSQVRSITRCLLITRRDGQSFGFTELDRDLIFAGITFKSFGGLDPTAIQSDLSFEPNNIEFASFLTTDGIKATDLMLGLFDYARVRFFMVNYLDLPTSFAESPPKFLALPVRVLGKVKFTDNNFTAELMGLTRFLEGRIGDVTSKTCRYEFGDARCGVNISTFETNIAVTTNRDNLSFYTTWNGENDRFTGSKATWLLGANSGVEFTIIRQLGNTFFLAAPLPVNPSSGDTFLAIPNCQKSFDNCNSFNNKLNFGGENKLPGLDALISTENQDG